MQYLHLSLSSADISLNGKASVSKTDSSPKGCPGSNPGIGVWQHGPMVSQRIAILSIEDFRCPGSSPGAVVISPSSNGTGYIATNGEIGVRIPLEMLILPFV